LYGKVPNIQLNNFSNTPNSAVITIRGIGVIEPDPYAGNTVSIVVDGVPQYFSMGALVELFDIERVEVLRGPQGTLFGANTTGGVVNITTHQPTGEFGGSIEATYGNYDRFDIKGVLDIPVVTDIIAAKFGIAHTRRDGYVTNVIDGKDLGKRDVTIFRGAVKFTPVSSFDATLSGEYTMARNGSPIVINGAYPGEILYAPPGVDGMYAGPCQNMNERCRAPKKYLGAKNASTPDSSDLNNYRATLTMNLRDTAIGDITSITAYKKFDLTEFTDQDGSVRDIFPGFRETRGRQFSQELRTAADITDSINLVAGLFYLDTKYSHEQRNKYYFAGPGLLNVNTQDQDNYSVSGFVQAYAQVTDRLRLQGGIRYTYEKTSMLAATILSVNPSGVTEYSGVGNTVLSAVTPPKDSKSWKNTGWKLGVDYELFDRTMAYGSWARGFKSGGFTGRIGIPQDLGPYDPEKVDTFEVGIKNDLFDGRLRLNFAAFYTNYRDMQIAQIYVTQDADGLPVQGNTILNAAKSTIKGFELEAATVPVDGLTLSGSLAYLDAKYKNFPYLDPLTITPENPNGVPVNLKGEQLQNAPHWSATAAINYDVQLPGNARAEINLSYSYVGKKYLTALLNSPRTTIQPTGTFDGNINIFPRGDDFSIGVWARNIFNKHYINNCYDSPGFLGFCGYSPPREYGVTARYAF